MATKTKSHEIAIRRTAPMVPKKKYEDLIQARQNAAKKAKEVASQRVGLIAGVAACGAVGYLERTNKMPSMLGIEPTAVLGVGLGLVLPMVIKGKAGAMAAEAGAALCGVAAYKLASGSPLRVGEDDEF